MSSHSLDEQSDDFINKSFAEYKNDASILYEDTVDSQIKHKIRGKGESSVKLLSASKPTESDSHIREADKIKK